MFSWGNKKKYLSGYLYHMTLVTLCIVRASRAKLSANVPAGCKMITIIILSIGTNWPEQTV